MLAANFQIFGIYLVLEKGVFTENLQMHCLRSKHIKKIQKKACFLWHRWHDANFQGNALLRASELHLNICEMVRSEVTSLFVVAVVLAFLYVFIIFYVFWSYFKTLAVILVSESWLLLLLLLLIIYFLTFIV